MLLKSPKSYTDFKSGSKSKIELNKIMPAIGITSNDIRVFLSPLAYQEQLFSLIEQAKTRIYITALYVQNDEIGQAVLHALYQAKQKNPQLDVKVFVDFHRAQRGLIGEKESLGNRELYLQLAQQYQEPINIYGVAVKSRELLGVLHLKGMVFDDQVFYSGASINDIYLQHGPRYRLDRYYQIASSALANSFCDYLEQTFVNPGYCPLLNQQTLPSIREQKKNILALKSVMKKSCYRVSTSESSGDIRIEPLIGFGRRQKQLNHSVRQLVQQSETSLLIFTPYFNLPKPLTKDIIRALKREVKITLVIGDKTASDFYIAEQENFSTIGIIPYLYELLLRRFVKRWQRYIDNNLLEIRLWKNADNSYHLKGIVADNRFHLLTGSNLNPRAWSLDLENGLLIDDIKGHLLPYLAQETAMIFEDTQVLNNYQQLEDIKQYPEKPRKLIKKIKTIKIERILKRFL